MEAPKVGDEVVFRYGREVLRGHVNELRRLRDADRWEPGIVMLEYEGLGESREFLYDEGLYWARGWTGPSADALRATVLLQGSAGDAA